MNADLFLASSDRNSSPPAPVGRWVIVKLNTSYYTIMLDCDNNAGSALIKTSRLFGPHGFAQVRQELIARIAIDHKPYQVPGRP